MAAHKYWRLYMGANTGGTNRYVLGDVELRVNSAGANLATAANFALSIVLARLLTPQEIGIFSMSAVLIDVNRRQLWRSSRTLSRIISLGRRRMRPPAVALSVISAARPN